MLICFLLDSTLGTITALIRVGHEDLILPHPESTVVMHNIDRPPFAPRTMTLPKGLPCFLCLQVLKVSPKMESFGDPPQTSESLLSTEDLDITPRRFQDGDVARMEVVGHSVCSLARFSDWVLLVRIAEKGNGEIGKPWARMTYELVGSVSRISKAGKFHSYCEMCFCRLQLTIAENGNLKNEDVAGFHDLSEKCVPSHTA